jgi:tight adherence protein B
MRERAQMRRQVRALSAEGRLSAYILIALPLLMAAYMFLVRADYIRPLYTTAAGLTMLIGSAVLIVVGSIWMRNIIKLEV